MLCFIISIPRKSPVAAPDDDISFPVMIHHGHQPEIAGHVKISPTETYASFNSTVGQPINLMEIVFPTVFSPLKFICKATISQWTDFSLISKQKDCFFLVTVRPPQFVEYQNQMLASGFINKVQEWQSRMNNETVDVNVESSASEIHIQEGEQDEERFPKVVTESGVCEECNTTGADEFHCCKLDAIVVGGYRTNFGPIGRRTIEPEKEQDGLYNLFGPIPDDDSNNLTFDF